MPKIPPLKADVKPKSIQICMQCGTSLVTKYADSLNGQPYCRSCYKVKVATARKRKAVELGLRALELLATVKQPADLVETVKQVDFPFDEALTTVFSYAGLFVIEIRKDNKSYRYQLPIEKAVATDNVLVLNDVDMDKSELEYEVNQTEIPAT